MENLKEMSIHSTTSLTASENGEHTYAFTKDFEELNGKRGVLILLYPTRTEENYHVEDSTTIHIMKHMKQLGLKSYTIVNLFSHVVRKRLSTRGLTIDEENLQFIKTEIFEKYDSEKDIVIIAWGNSHETSQAVNELSLIGTGGHSSLESSKRYRHPIMENVLKDMGKLEQEYNDAVVAVS